MSKENQTQTKENNKTVARQDIKVRKSVADITQKPKNNDDVNKMKKRYFYEKTKNWVVYGRMLQLKRRDNIELVGDVLKIKVVEKTK